MALLKRKRSGLTDPMSVVTRFVNACNRHDADGIYACLHPDFDSIQPMYPARNFRGADQVRRNWQAIFDAEPGFRLTVLRQAAADDTVWLELHGAGDEAEVAGVFVMGIQGDRVRWARIYSALVEPLPPGVEPHVPSSPALRGVPSLKEGDGAAVASEPVVEEDLIAPVVDIEDSGRSRRRRRRRGHEPADAPVAAAEDEAVDVAAVTDDAEPRTVSREAAEAALEDLLGEPDVVPAPTAAEPEPAAQPEAASEPEPEPQPEPEPEPEPEPLVTSTVEPVAEPVAEPLEEREPEVVAEPIVSPVEEAAVVLEPAAGPEPGDAPPPPPETAVPAEPEATAEPAMPEPQPLEPVAWPEPTATAVVEPEPEPTAIVEPEPEPAAKTTSHPDADDDDDGSSGKRRGWLRR